MEGQMLHHDGQGMMAGVHDHGGADISGSVHNLSYEELSMHHQAMHQQNLMQQQQHQQQQQQHQGQLGNSEASAADIHDHTLHQQHQAAAAAMASLGLPANLASYLQPGADPSLLLDPNDPASAQTLAQLLQIQQSLASGQLHGSGPSTESLGSLSALVSAAVALAQQQEGGGGLQGNNMSSLLGIDPNSEAGQAALTNMGMLGEMGHMGGMGGGGGMGHSGDGNADGDDDQVAKYRSSSGGGGRPRKSGGSGSGHGGGAPGGNWMRRYHEFCYLGDKSSLDSAKMNSSSIIINVQWVNMPEELQSRVPTSPAPIEVPSNATVAYLKRAICRALGGNLWPTVLRSSWTKEELQESPEDRLLSSYQIENNGTLVHMEANYLPIPEVNELMLQNRQHQPGALAISSPAGTKERFTLCEMPAGTKERFTLSEMYALVDGMEVHGLKVACKTSGATGSRTWPMTVNIHTSPH
eukprot:gene12462-15667_t